MPKDKTNKTATTWEIVFRNWRQLSLAHKLIFILGGLVLVIAYAITRFMLPENNSYALQQPETPPQPPASILDLALTQPAQPTPPLPQLHMAAAKAKKAKSETKKTIPPQKSVQTIAEILDQLKDVKLKICNKFPGGLAIREENGATATSRPNHQIKWGPAEMKQCFKKLDGKNQKFNNHKAKAQNELIATFSLPKNCEHAFKAAQNYLLFFIKQQVTKKYYDIGNCGELTMLGLEKLFQYDNDNPDKVALVKGNLHLFNPKNKAEEHQLIIIFAQDQTPSALKDGHLQTLNNAFPGIYFIDLWNDLHFPLSDLFSLQKFTSHIKKWAQKNHIIFDKNAMTQTAKAAAYYYTAFHWDLSIFPTKPRDACAQEQIAKFERQFKLG